MMRPIFVLLTLLISIVLGNQEAGVNDKSCIPETICQPEWTTWSKCDSSGTIFRERTQTVREIRTGCCGQDVLRPRDCAEIFKSGQPAPGVYNIWIRGEKLVRVACMEDGWTVFQSRGQFGNPRDYFYRNWSSYVNGFGVPGKEHWLGLDNLHDLTNNKTYQLRITMKNFRSVQKIAYYDNFYLVNRVDYKLEYGKYHGTAGDSLSWSKGQKFSTFDKDNDANRHSCAVKREGAWWYRSCSLAHLNGPNSGVEEISNWNSIVWDTFGSPLTNLHSVQMAIRPMDFSP